MVHLCESCNEPAERRCSGCSKVWYCQKSCQESHWFIHLFHCKPKDQITTADHLYRAVVADEVPSDEQTRHDYGFSRAFGQPNQSYLLGTYIDLMLHLKVKARTLHLWRVSGTLVQNIISKFQTLPHTNRGAYFPWFLENHWWVLDGNIGPRAEEIESAKKEAEKMLNKGWLYSGGFLTATTNQIKEVMANWPEEKATCMMFCGLMLSGATLPGPFMDAWKQFGFCTCDLHQEKQLARLYTRLLHSCTFQEFLSAFESSRLADLFVLKGLEFEFSLFPYLEELLQNSPRIFHSVWELKKFAVESHQLKDPDRIIPAVFVDYGFVNCRTQEERNDLKSVYKEYFLDSKKDPPALHRACIEGRLIEYISTVIKLKEKKKFRRLMKNHYPLPEVL